MSGLALWDGEIATAVGEGVTGVTSVPGGRTGSCLTVANGSSARPYWGAFLNLPAPPVVRYGFAAKFTGSLASGTSGFTYANLQGSSTAIPRPFVNADGTVTIKRSSTVLASSTKAFELDKWYYVECLSQPHPSAGRAVFRVDGEDWINFTGNTGTAPIAAITSLMMFYLYAPAGGSLFFDDAYLMLDGAANDWLGDITVVGLTTEAAVSNTGWNVGAIPPTTTKQLSSTATGQALELSLSDLAPELTGEPLGVAAHVTAKNTGGTTLGLRASIGDGSGESSISAADTYVTASTLTPGNPNDLTVRLESL